MYKELLKTHQRLFKEKDFIYLKAPSRINLIGEHIDYNGGNVMPGCINLYMHGIISKSNDIQIYSENYKELGKIVIPTNSEIKILKSSNAFINYVLGCVKVLQNEGHDIKGLKLSINSEIPTSSGLSSSAALGVLILQGLNKIYDLNYSNEKIAKLFKMVENKYMKLKNGIMDQFIIICGEKENIMQLNTKTLEYTHHKFKINGYSLIIFNTNKKRDLIHSKFNQRVEECQKALSIINSHGYEFEDLCSIPIDRMQYFSKFLLDNKIKKRFEYIVEEQDRTKKFINALNNQNLLKIGKILNEGHDGLKNKYNVSCKELDYIHDQLIKSEHVIGARMTGAGFGGCIISIINENKYEEIIRKVSDKYYKKFGYPCTPYKISIVSGINSDK